MMIKASNTERARGHDPAVSSEIVPQPDVGKKREEVKTDSQKQEETESQPLPEIKSQVQIIQLDNKSTGDEQMHVIEESQR